MLCDILRDLVELCEHLKELIDDRGGGEALDPTAPSTAGDDAFDLTVQELHREPAGRLVIATAVSVFIGSLNSTVAEAVESEVTGLIARGKGDGAGETDDHGVLL